MNIINLVVFGHQINQKTESDCSFSHHNGELNHS